MITPLDVQIRERIAAFVAGDASVRQFDEWFASATWDAEDTADPATLELIYELRHALKEHSSGLWTDDEMRDLVRPRLATDVFAAASAKTSPR